MLYLPPPSCASPLRRDRPTFPTTLHAVEPGHGDRAHAEAFIRRVYRERYGAKVQAFAPRLVVLRDAAGAIVAAAGYRPAGTQALYLERYLDAPVETLIAVHDGHAPSRASIVEVGHLAASRFGEGRRLIMLLAPYLAAHGFQWAVSTLTEELRHLFVRLGMPPLQLGVADPAALGTEARDWGRYYDHRPAVLAGRIDTMLKLLARRRTRR